ncbi:MAG TPA: NUDIX hydrolase [Caulobacteraceae bacterium]|jgi:8-oxo-dGTP pyrophosphatase MutT (NUDIX family)
MRIETASAFLISADEKVLLGRRAAWKAAWPDCWDTVGGRIESGETPELAVIREVQEEVGVKPTTLIYLAAIPETRPDLYGEALHHIFAVSAWTGGHPRNHCDEHSEMCWFTIEELARLAPLAGSDCFRLAKLAIVKARAPEV